MNKMNLKLNETITVLMPNELIPTKITGRLKGYYFSEYAQYEDALYLFIQRPRAKKIDRVVITSDTAFIFRGKFEECWRKEVLSKDQNTTVSQLHRITYEDIKENENLLYYHGFREKFNINKNIEWFIDSTADYMMDHNIRHFEAEENEGYINYIKELLCGFNLKNILDTCKLEGYGVLENCIKKAVEYNW